MPRKLKLSGLRFGKLVAIKPMPTYKGNKHGIRWECKCDCGNICYPTASNLKNGNSKSCGCVTKENSMKSTFKHGMKHTKVYNSWLSMRDRCNNPKNLSYANYGGRGIKVCKRWDVFLNFLEDMGIPKDGETIERKDVNGDYNPDNCVWLSKHMQARNKTVSRILTLGNETHCLVEWSEILGIKYWTLHARLRRGWSDEKTLALPLIKK